MLCRRREFEFTGIIGRRDIRGEGWGMYLNKVYVRAADKENKGGKVEWE